MKQKLLFILIGFYALFLSPIHTYAGDFNLYDLPVTPPLPCNKIDPSLSCPIEMTNPVYNKISETCATSYEDFLADPVKKHYWVEDDDITAQGKADDRARQFLYWVINTSAIDEAPVLRTIWNVSSLIALFGVVLVAAIFGIGYIISQRTQYNFNIRIWPTIIKIGVMLLYIAFSAAIVFVLIQLSEILMKFFYENLGGRDLFNIYFSNNPAQNLVGQTEENYKGFVGCRDLNIRVKDGIDAEVFLLKLTNITYYVMGTMLLLRKILLWFLLFVSPFLALLMPFIFIRNTGWIWIGVFFQWLFYGPLLTLFLGGMARIWRDGIPWSFDFSRVSKVPEGYIYPTGINIVYGGPAQRIQGLFNRPIGATNNGNYIDTFAEYIITLIMLWAVTFFPWWLLRIFRDYCCEGIYAMKNILLAMYNQMQGGPSPKGPSPQGPGPTLPSFNLETPTPVRTNITVGIGSLENIRNIGTRDIAKNLNLNATRISDIARVETNKQMNTTMNQNLTYLSNPVKAQTPVERQQYMKLRAELFNRAIKSDSVAHTILASTSTSQVERSSVYREILKSMPVTVKVSVEQATAAATNQSQQQVKNVTNTYTTAITKNASVINTISKSTSTSSEVVKNILQSYSKHTTEPITTIVKTIAKETNTSETTVREVLSHSGAIGIQAKFIAETSETQKLTKEQTTRILDSMMNTVQTTTEKSMMEQITSTTNLPPAPVQNFITNVYNALATNEQTVQQIAGGSGTPPEQVANILNAYSTQITTTNNSPETIITTIAQELKTNVSTVENVVNTANSVMQTSDIVSTVAQEQHITNEQAQSIVQTLSQPATVTTAKEEFTTTIQQYVSGDEAPAITDTTVQNIVESFASNENLVQQISQKTQSSESDVKNILYSYAQNLSTSSSNITNTIAKQTGIQTSEVQNVLETVSTSITNTPDIIKEVSESIKVDQPTVQKVVNAIPQTITVKQEAPNIVTLNNMTSNSKDTIQKVVQSLATSTELVTQVAHNTNQSESTVTNVLQSYATNIEKTDASLLTTISQTTGVDRSNVQSIISNTATTIRTTPAIQQTLGQSVSVEAPAVQAIAQTIENNVSTTQAGDTPIIEHIVSQTSAVNEESLHNLFTTISNNQTFIQQVADSAKVAAPVVQSLLQTFENNLHEATTNIAESIAKTTNLSQQQIQQVMQSIAQNVQSSSEVKQALVTNTNLSSTTIDNITQALPAMVKVKTDESKDPVVKMISNNSNVSESSSKSAVQNIMNSFMKNETLMQSISDQTGLKEQQITNIINTYTQNIDKPAETIVAKISETSGIQKENVRTALHSISDTIMASDTVIKDVAQKEHMKTEDVANVIQNQMQMAVEPEKNIEKTITIPQSVSLEDYEEVKKMWMKHYEEGEVPVSDTIKTRTEWIDQEIVFITNTLNKLLSPDEKLRQEGLEELGYLLPIFLINNLKGEELIVYLKAKLEAAKSILQILERENKIRETIKEEEDEDTKVFVERKKEEKDDKHMALDEDEEEESKAPQSIEDRVKAVQEKLSTAEDDAIKDETVNDSMKGIREKLQEEAEKNDTK